LNNEKTNPIQLTSFISCLWYTQEFLNIHQNYYFFNEKYLLYNNAIKYADYSIINETNKAEKFQMYIKQSCLLKDWCKAQKFDICT